MKTITVKGTGRISAAVDTVELSFSVSEKHKDYDKALGGAAAKVDALERALSKADVPAKDLQTGGFQVHTEYEGERDRNGDYRNVFAGYVCSYELKLRFGFDPDRLGAALAAVAESKALPQMNISFTVGEPETLRAVMLQAAADQARAKAECLCAAAGVRLGELQKIDYDFGHLDFRSDTVMDMGAGAMKAKRSLAANFRPEDIALQDSAVFVWEIL